MTAARTGLDEAEFIKHYETLYGPHLAFFEANQPGAVIGVSAPIGGLNPSRWAPLHDRAEIFRLIRNGTRKSGRSVRVTLAPRTAEITARPDGGRGVTGGQDDVASVVAVRADFDTSDGDHYEKNLPSREQLPEIYASCPLGLPTLRLRTVGGEHADWCLAEPVSAAEGKHLASRMVAWLEWISEERGLHIGDPGVTRSVHVTSRFAGTVHGKPGGKQDYTLFVIDAAGPYYVAEDFMRLPEAHITAKERARRAELKTRRAERRAAGDVDGNLPTWKQFSLALPVTRVLEDVIGMRPLRDTDSGSTIWTWPDAKAGSGSAESYTHEENAEGEKDGMEKVAVYGESTAAILRVAAKTGGHTSYSLLLGLFCEGDARLAGSIARRFLASGVDGAIEWMHQHFDTGTMSVIDPETAGRSIEERVAAARAEARAWSA